MELDILLKALAQQSVEDADTAAWILDQNPEDVCEERMPWNELCDKAYNLAAGFTTLHNAVNAFLSTQLNKVPEDDECKSQTSQPSDAHEFRLFTYSQSDCDMIEAMAAKAAEETKVGYTSVKAAKECSPEYLFDIPVVARGLRNFDDFEKRMQDLLLKEGYCAKVFAHDVRYQSNFDLSRGMVAIGNGNVLGAVDR